ncbi:NTPCR [Symbiodinium sp. CCMP2456]|nr:NTPCR [Symbiodinium sp. CCMP2456]
MALLATTCRSHLSVATLRLWLRRSASSQVQAEGAADVQNEKPQRAVTSSRTLQRKGPGALIDFEFIDRALEPHRHARDAADTWSGLRATVEMTLSRGNLDTHLWWRHAADARKRLLEWKSTVQTSEDAIDATAVIVSCARAEVEPRTGVYASWIRAVLASNASRHARLEHCNCSLCLHQSLDSRLSEVSPELLAALAHAMASVRLPISQARSAAPASQLLQSLSRRSKKPASVDLLCRSAGVLADAGGTTEGPHFLQDGSGIVRGLVMPSDAWMVVEAAGPILAQISDLGRAELFRMLALLGIDDEPVLSLLQADAPQQGLLAETPQAFEPSAAGLPTAQTLGRGRESPAASQAAAAFLEASALLPSGLTPAMIDGSVEALAGASASTQLRSVLALTSLGHSSAAAELEAALWDRPLCYDAAEAEELLRLLPALPSQPSRSLLNEIIGFLSEDGPRCQLSADQGASAVLSCSLLDTTMDVWQLVVDGEGMVPEAISFPALLQLCLAAVLEASASPTERLGQVGVLPLLRQKSEQRRSHCSTGAELVLLQLLQAVSQRDYDWPLELISKVCPIVAVRPRPWLHSAEASKRTDAWLQLLLADDDGFASAEPLAGCAAIRSARKRLSCALLRETSRDKKGSSQRRS